MNAKEFLKEQGYTVSDRAGKTTEWLMEAYHRAKVEEVTDEEIDGQSTKYTDEMEYAFRRGAKWIRDKLLNQ